ncbi:MAG TPA: hypothetical protein VIM38_09270 [Alphaproteobacteria bacterium]
MIPTKRMCARRFARGLTAIAVAAFALSLGGAYAQQGPIRIGLGISQSGGVAPAGKQLLVAIQLVYPMAKAQTKR